MLRGVGRDWRPHSRVRALRARSEAPHVARRVAGNLRAGVPRETTWGTLYKAHLE